MAIAPVCREPAQVEETLKTLKKELKKVGIQTGKIEQIKHYSSKYRMDIFPEGHIILSIGDKYGTATIREYICGSSIQRVIKFSSILTEKSLPLAIKRIKETADYCRETYDGRVKLADELISEIKDIVGDDYKFEMDLSGPVTVTANINGIKFKFRRARKNSKKSGKVLRKYIRCEITNWDGIDFTKNGKLVQDMMLSSELMK